MLLLTSSISYNVGCVPSGVTASRSAVQMSDTALHRLADRAGAAAKAAWLAKQDVPIWGMAPAPVSYVPEAAAPVAPTDEDRARPANLSFFADKNRKKGNPFYRGRAPGLSEARRTTTPGERSSLTNIHMAITVLLFFAANSAAITMLQPRLAVLPPSCRAAPLMQLSNDASFLNDPFQYISDHPEMFSDDVRVMAAYQQTLQDSALNLWGDLPEKLDECAERAATLRTKSARAFELAQIILQAERGTMQTLAADSTFQEKKVLFDTLNCLYARRLPWHQCRRGSGAERHRLGTAGAAGQVW